MGTDLAAIAGTAAGRVARESIESLSANVRRRSRPGPPGLKGVAAGLGLAAAAPLASKGARKLASRVTETPESRGEGKPTRASTSSAAASKDSRKPERA